jgi:transketolase
MKALNEYTDMRAVYADTLIELAGEDERVVALDADLIAANGTAEFRRLYPQRMINVGVAEANMVGVAAGLSSRGFIPFASTFGCFATRRAFDQFFLSANYARRQVKLIGTDPGVTAQFNGGTHMPFCDMSLMRVIPDLVVVDAADTVSLYKLLRQVYAHPGCVYMRMHRKGAMTIYEEDQEVTLGKGIVISDGSDVTLIASGMVMVGEAIKAEQLLSAEGISAAVIDMHTIKPLDEELVGAYAKKTRAVVTCENAQRIGGLGSAVSEYLSESCPTRMRRVGVHDEFGEVGTQQYLQERFGLTAEKIVSAAKELIALK